MTKVECLKKFNLERAIHLMNEGRNQKENC